MIRTCVIAMSLIISPLVKAELLLCEDANLCSFVCDPPNRSIHTELAYANDRVSVDRVRVEAHGDNNVLYTFERFDKTMTVPTYRPLEALVLPNDYQCRLSPTGLLNGVLGAEG